jgi:HEPN domain-containing protein
MSDQNLSEAQRWLQQAKHDFEVAQWSAKGGYWSHVCFMAQQAGEKALKAFLYAKGERNVVGHALLVLVRRCVRHEASFEELEPLCRRLDKFYVITRYPDGLPGLVPSEYFDEDEANQSLEAANSILQAVGNALTQDNASNASSPTEAEDDRKDGEG